MTGCRGRGGSLPLTCGRMLKPSSAASSSISLAYMPSQAGGFPGLDILRQADNRRGRAGGKSGQSPGGPPPDPGYKRLLGAQLQSSGTQRGRCVPVRFVKIKADIYSKMYLIKNKH